VEALDIGTLFRNQIQGLGSPAWGLPKPPRELETVNALEAARSGCRASHAITHLPQTGQERDIDQGCALHCKSPLAGVGAVSNTCPPHGDSARSRPLLACSSHAFMNTCQLKSVL
jgi:hypothetical protein